MIMTLKSKSRYCSGLPKMLVDAIQALAVFLVSGGVILAGMTILAMMGDSVPRPLKEIENELKKYDFSIYYRGVKARTRLISCLPEMIKKNDQFLKENPDYVEGALCGKLKEKK